ncbi:MAG TPA: helix-turn-helix domain-containing protein [Terriglobia bacterium]|jgi:DNA-binding HxlR family transcriptional regulator|nr:helix-turn-helix domain-containing protein [Terriglobia bacterium]
MVPNDAPGSSRGPDGGGTVHVAALVENIIGCKWSIRLLQLCAEGKRRPSLILRSCPGLSAKVMNERLRKMVRFGILQRTVFGEKPPVEVEYRLTPLGNRFMRIIDEVRRLQQDVDQRAVPTGDGIEENRRQQSSAKPHRKAPSRLR